MMNEKYIQPEYRARELKEEYGSSNIYEFAENLNIKVVKRKIKDGILGGCKAVGLKRLIVIDPDIDDEEFVIAHQIGHIMLRHGDNCCSNDDIFESETSNFEKEANLFAIELLK